jgi:hypothetical protein
MTFGFLIFNFILEFKLMLESSIKNKNFCLKNHEDNFDERYHLNNRFKIIYVK